MKMKKILALVLAVVLVFSAVGCASGGTGSTGSTTSTAGDTSAYPGTPDANTLVLNIGTEPPNLNTLVMTDTVSFSVLRHVTENLVMLDETDNVIPGCAESWTVSDDGLVYNFKLREGMKWSNGEPVTANDFIFAWKTLMDPATASEYAYFGYIIKNGAAYNEGKATADDLGLKAISDTELEVTLESPTAYALNMFAFGSLAPVNEKFFTEVGLDAYNTSAETFCTNGAYKITSWTHEADMQLVKNPEYWDAANVSVENIKFTMILDSNAILNSFKAGEIDMGLLTGDQVAMMKEEGYPIQQYADGSCFYMEFNTTQPGLNNVKIRTALGLAVDKQVFIDSILKNSSSPAVGFVSPTVTGAKDPFQDEMKARNGGNALLSASSDVEQAKKLLEEGLAEENMTAADLALTIISDDSDQAVKYATFIQEQINTNLGLDMKIESMPFKSRLERMTNKDFSVVFAGWGPDYNDPNTFLDLWVSTGGNNHTGYANPDYDKLIADAAVEVDAAKRMEMLYQAEEMVCKDVPIYPIYWRVRDYVVSGKVDGGFRTMLQDINFKNAKIK